MVHFEALRFLYYLYIIITFDRILYSTRVYCGALKFEVKFSPAENKEGIEAIY
jgi:hypothetical protein